MKKIKFGLKLWSTNTEFIDRAEELVERNIFNYIELTYFPETNITPFLNSDLDYIIHLPTYRHNVNIADKNNFEKNLKVIREGLQWAEDLDAKYAILHPGFGNLENARTFLNRIEDKKILIENMPKVGLTDGKMVGYSNDQLRKLMANKFGFCFDLNHAIKTAISLNEDYKEYIKKLLKLNPQIFHVADGRLDFEKDEHLDIGEGEYDWKFLTDVIKESDCNYVTIETPRDTLEDDLKNLNTLKNFINL